MTWFVQGVCEINVLIINGVRMTRLALFLFIFVGLAVASVAVLSSWHIPAPTVAINKVIMNAKLSK
jgi:hypothetical protein